MRRSLVTPGRGFVVLMFSIVVAASLGTTTDPDLWWHLRTGDVIVNRGLPIDDIFSFTVPGTEWVTHEWLSQVLLWAIWSVAGAPGLIVVFAAITVAAFVVAARSSTAPATHAAGVAAVAAVAANVSTGVRPQMLNLLGTAIVVLVCERVRRGEWGAERLFWLPAIVLLWANLHSGFFVGLAVMGVYVVGEAWQRRTADQQRTMPAAVTRRLALLTIGSFALAGVNPSGPKLWLYPFETLGSDAMRDVIREWHSPDFHQPVFWPFAALVLGAVVLAARARPGLRVTQGLLLVGTAMAGLQSMRHISLFAIVAVPIVADLLGTVLAGRAAPARHPSPVLGPLAAGLGLILAVMMVQAAISGNDRAVAQTYPIEAVDWLEQTGRAGGPGFNSYGWGGYLVWRGVPVYIDGRADVYGDEMLTLYATAHRGQPGWREALDRFDVDWALVGAGSNLAVLLDEAPDWTLAYRDDQAAVYDRLPPG